MPAGCPPAVFASRADQVFDRALDVRPVFLEEPVIRLVQRLAVGLEDAARVAVGKRLLARRARRRRHLGPVVDPAVRALLVHEVNPAHVPLQRREQARRGSAHSPRHACRSGSQQPFEPSQPYTSPLAMRNTTPMCRMMAALAVTQSSSQ